MILSKNLRNKIAKIPRVYYSMRIIILLFPILILFGCQSGISRGGQASIDRQQVIESVSPDGTTTKTTTRTTTVIKQPENPKDPGVINYDGPKDKIDISTGASNNIAKSLASVNLLQIPMYAGIGMVMIGVLIGAFLKNYRWAITIGASGLAMVAASFLLAEFAIYFMGLFVIFVAYIGYLAYDYVQSRKAAAEIVKTNEVLKTANMVDKENLAKVADKVQSESTKKIVRKLKENA